MKYRSKNLKAVTILRQQAKYLYFFLALIVGLLIVLKSVDYLTPDFSRGFLRGKENVFSWYAYALYAHMAAAPVALFAGLLQFIFTKKKAHRFFGMLYVVAVLFLAAPSGLVMAFKAIGGWPGILNFVWLSLLWFWFTWKAYTSVRKGNYPAHRRFMIRSFILANSAVMLRLLGFVANQYFTTDPVPTYVFISWCSWLPGLLVFEGLNLRRSRIDGYGEQTPTTAAEIYQP
jgi:uncharacterized membrane protein